VPWGALGALAPVIYRSGLRRKGDGHLKTSLYGDIRARLRTAAVEIVEHRLALRLQAHRRARPDCFNRQTKLDSNESRSVKFGITRVPNPAPFRQRWSTRGPNAPCCRPRPFAGPLFHFDFPRSIPAGDFKNRGKALACRFDLCACFRRYIITDHRPHPADRLTRRVLRPLWPSCLAFDPVRSDSGAPFKEETWPA
jgi:hypothetical protein